MLGSQIGPSRPHFIGRNGRRLSRLGGEFGEFGFGRRSRDGAMVAGAELEEKVRRGEEFREGAGAAQG